MKKLKKINLNRFGIYERCKILAYSGEDELETAQADATQVKPSQEVGNISIEEVVFSTANSDTSQAAFEEYQHNQAMNDIHEKAVQDVGVGMALGAVGGSLGGVPGSALGAATGAAGAAYNSCTGSGCH